MTDAEVAQPDVFASDEALNKLIGTQVRLSIGQKEKQQTPGEFKNVVDSYLPVKTQLPEFDPDKVSKESGEQTGADATVANIDFDE